MPVKSAKKKYIALLVFPFLFFSLNIQAKNLSIKNTATIQIQKQKKKQKNSRTHPKWYLVMELIRGTRSRYHAMSSLKKSMSPKMLKSMKSLARVKDIDLRKPVEIKVYKNLDFALGNGKYRFIWDAKKRTYSYNGRPFAYNKEESVTKNFKNLEKLFKMDSVSWLDLFISRAYAQDYNQVIFDLNYLLYMRSIEDEQQLINELGTDYLLKADEKLRRLVQENNFLRMECNYGAHSMEATIVLGDGSAENEVRLIASDLGQGTITNYVEKNGRRTESSEISSSASPLLSQSIFNEICMNMTALELDQYSQDLWYFGGESGGVE